MDIHEENLRKSNTRVARELEPRLLSHFLAVAQTGSISAAAEMLNLSQPALSKSIKHLEDRLEIVLLNRFPTGTTLTRYGEALARRGRSIQREVGHALNELQSLKGGSTGTLRVGAGPIWSAVYLPPVYASFLAERPGVKLEIQNGVIDTLLPKLNDNSLDIIFTTLDFPNSSGIVKEALVGVEHGLFARQGHPLFSLSKIEPADLQAWGWAVMKNDYVGRNRLNAYFNSNGLGPPQVQLELAPDFSMLCIVEQSDLLCSLPVEMGELAAAHGVHRLPIEDVQLWESKAGVAYRKTDFTSPILDAFLAIVREKFEAPLPIDGA